MTELYINSADAWKNSLFNVSPPYEAFKNFTLSEQAKNIVIEAPPDFSNVSSSRVFSFQEPRGSIASLYGLPPKQTMEEQYNNVQEQLSELTKTHNEERKENLETQRKKDKQIEKLQNEKEQLIKKHVRVKTKLKSYKDELKRREQLSEALIEIEDLREEIRQLRVEIEFRKENR